MGVSYIRTCHRCHLCIHGSGPRPHSRGYSWMMLGGFLTLFLVVVDAHSKWSEIYVMKSTTSQQTIIKLHEIFVRNGAPEQLVSDNGPRFTSDELNLFMKWNRIKHIPSAPYHPATNGLAERFVQTFKQAFRSAREEEGTIEAKFARFLISYRNAPHATTGESLAKMFLGRPLRTDWMQLNLISEKGSTIDFFNGPLVEVKATCVNFWLDSLFLCATTVRTTRG